MIDSRTYAIKCFECSSLNKNDKLGNILLNFRIPGMNNVVDMRSHK